MKPSQLASRGHSKILARLCLVIHEVAEGTMDRSLSDRSIRNTPGVDLLHLSIVLYGLVDEIRVPKVSLQ